MAIFLALLTAAIFGVGDFCGGLAAKRARVLQVVAGSHLVGAIGAVAAALVLADRFVVSDAALGVAGGAFGVVGVGLLYRRLAVGPMSVVAPLTAITSAVVPTGWGILDGERLNLLGWFGVALGLMAVLLVSLSSDGDGIKTDTGADTRTETATDTEPGTGTRTGADAGSAGSAAVTPQVIAESLLAGVGFGAMFIFLDATTAESSPWPVASARVFTSLLLIGFLLAVNLGRGGPVFPTDRQALGLIGLVGLLDTGSNVLFLYAANLGQLAVVSVLAALYPISTVILARVVLGERMSRVQGLGFLAAIAATELLVLG